MVKPRARLRVGFVGCGRATQNLHLPGFRHLADWQVIAAADNDEGRLNVGANRFGIPRRYNDYQSLLADPNVDVVAVCVPPRLHVEVSLAALAAGKHVFIEKPLAVSLPECDQILDQAARSPRKVMVGFNLRWHRLIRRSRKMIQDGALGELEFIRTTFTTGGRLQAGSPEWSSWRAPGGGVLFDLGVHHFDLWRYLTGAEVEEISAMSHSRDGGEQSAIVTARMDNGLLITSVFSDQTTESNELEICGRKGSIRVSCYRFDGLEFITAPGSFGGFQRLPSKLLATLREIPSAMARAPQGGEFRSTYEAEWRAFGHSIRSDTPVESTLEDGRRAVQISLAALASDSESRAVKVSESPRKSAEATARPSAGEGGGLIKTATSVGPESDSLSGASLPAISVILATPDCYETIRKTISNLRAQSVSKQLELIIIAPSAAALNLVEDDMKDFFCYGVVEAGPIRSIGSANALGIRHATGPVIALAEDHSFPEPDWAQALIETQRQPWAAVGPVIRNANPASRLSCADMLIGYGPWMDPAPAGFVDYLPGHNSSYKREILLEYGSGLERMMEAETVLHWDLRAKGHKLYLEPAAKIVHTNHALPAHFIASHFYGGRVFATVRAHDAHWAWSRRLLFACGSPLIPLVRLWRILRDISRYGRGGLRSALRVIPQLLLGLTMDGAGQMLGYIFGAGAETTAKLTGLEFHRNREECVTGAEKSEHGRVPGPSTAERP
jgi:predicted dehydrogenase